MEEAEIWSAIAKCSWTPEGVQERLRLIALLGEASAAAPPPAAEPEEPGRIGPALVAALAAEGFEIERRWCQDDRATGIALNLLRQTPAGRRRAAAESAAARAPDGASGA